MFKLRRYQSEAREAIEKAWEEDRKVLLVLPTGCGKTVVFASVANDCVEQGHRVLILAHREELLDQASDKLKKAYDLDTVLEKAESSSVGSDVPVVVGSVQSLAQDKRLAQFPPDYFDEVIVDEAHHSLSDSYQKVLEHFDGAKVLGVTATPDRGDKKNLAQYFDKIAYEYKLTTAIKEGYLSPIKAQMIPLNIDLSAVKISDGDFAVNEIGSALDPYLEQIANQMVKYCRDRKTVVFLPLITTSQKFCEMLKKRGFRAAEVNGNSSNRAEILSDFEQDEYNILCNSMLLTEGWDCPSVDCIVVLRPTKVRSLYQQMVGRGMRLSPGKTELLLIDFLWMTERHDLCRQSSLVATDDDVKAKIDKMIEDGEPIDIMEAEEAAQKDVLAEREEALKKQLEAQRRKRAKTVDPIQYMFSIADEDLTGYVPTFAWEMEPPTQKQMDMLEKRGINPEAVQNAGQASMIIDRLIKRQQEGLATPKQIRCLERFGFQKVGTWSFGDANSMISRLSMNKWRMPNGVDPHTYKPTGIEVYMNGF